MLSLPSRDSAVSFSLSASSASSSRHSNSFDEATKPTSRTKKECWLPSCVGDRGQIPAGER